MENMKKIIKYLLILFLIISLVVNIVLLNNNNSKIRINTEGINRIIMVNISAPTAFTAKEITGRQDIDDISHMINNTSMRKVKNYDRKAGGTGYVFIIEYATDVMYISYGSGEVLSNNGNYYKINSTNLESFWNLPYDAREFRFSGFVNPS